MKDPIELAWFTGFYEGEGWVTNDISNSNKLRLGLNQNDPTPLYEAKKYGEVEKFDKSIKLVLKESIV